MNKKSLKFPLTGLILVLVLAGLGLGLMAGHFLIARPQEEGVPLGAATEPGLAPESAPDCTRYTNEEFSFSLCYPTEWALPKEMKIEPSQQHLYQITFNPSGKSYMVNVFDRPAPVSLGSFVRDYFKSVEAGVSWTKDVEINSQEALQFFIPRGTAALGGIGGIAFGKERRVLTITGPSKRIQGEDFEQVVNEETLTQLAESFRWVE